MCKLIDVNFGFKFVESWIEKDCFWKRVVGMLWEDFIFGSKCESNEGWRMKW